MWRTDTLQSNTTYYWQIVARDRYGAETSGPVWSFSTGDEVWAIETIEAGLSSDCDLSIATDGQDLPHVSYVGPYPYALRYASRSGTEWQIDTIVADVPRKARVSLAIDTDGLPHVSYRGGNLSYASRPDSSWLVQEVDGTSTANCALALDSSNYPHIAYIVSYSYVLRHAGWDGSAWIIQNIEAGVDGANVAIAIDSSDNPHICYRVENTVKYAVWTGSAWTTAGIYTGESDVYGCSLALTADDQPCVSFIDAASTGLVYATKMGDSWAIETAAVLNYAYSPWSPSLQLDSLGLPHIMCPFRHSTCECSAAYVTRPGTDWVTDVVDGGMSWTAQLWLALDSDDRPHIGYRTGSRVQYARRTSGTGDE